MAQERDRQRRAAERRGRHAEFIAALALMLKGWRIVVRRYRTPLGEIDLVIRRGDLVAFVEVKARADLRAGVDSVSYASERRIRAAGETWLSRQPDGGQLSWRCDIVVVSSWRWPTHIEDAF